MLSKDPVEAILQINFEFSFPLVVLLILEDKTKPVLAMPLEFTNLKIIFSLIPEDKIDVLSMIKLISLLDNVEYTKDPEPPKLRLVLSFNAK